MKLGKKLLMGFVTGILALALGGYSMATHIITLNQLRDMNLDVTEDYILDNDIDASATVGWNGGLGFIPVGTLANEFTGSFDGQGFTVTGLVINRGATDYIGLFGWAKGATIRNVTMANVNITGEDIVGALIGTARDNCVITNCHSSGTVLGQAEVGGLIGSTGHVAAPGNLEQVSSCSSSANVTTSVTGLKAGGLVGETLYSTISDCFATGTVISLGGFSTGGLIGIAQTVTISDCYATGNATGINYVGGLIGDYRKDSTLSNCHATGDVSGEEEIGGLLGSLDEATVSDSYASGNVTATALYAGGLIGRSTQGDTLRCCANGDVTGTTAVGGLIGSHEGWTAWGSVTKCYSLGAVLGSGDNVGGLCGGHGDSTVTISDCFSRSPATGVNRVGGLIGVLSGPIQRCFSTGLVSASGIDPGGLIGKEWAGGATTDSFWDTQTSGQAASDGGTGKTTEQMQTRSTFTDAGWDFVTVWGACAEPLYLLDYPFLLDNGKCESIDCTAKEKISLPPDTLWCEQKKNPRDVTDAYPEFSAIYRDP